MAERSERYQRWKAREKFRSHVGWATAWIGALGVMFLLSALAILASRAGAGTGTMIGNPYLRLFVGGALLYSALGLWNAKAWARWAAVVLCALVTLSGNLSIPIGLLAIVYLLHPATARNFALARGSRGA